MKIVTICGSIKYYNKILEVAQKLETSKNYNVLIPIFSKDVTITEKDKKILGDIHKEKIKISDAIFVINVDGYIGENTKSEIEYAKSLNKEIMYLEENNETFYI